MVKKMIDGMISVKDAAEMTHIKYPTLLVHVKAGKFPRAKLMHGTRWFIHMDDVKKLMANEISLLNPKKVKKESEFEKQAKEILKARDCKAVKIQGIGTKDMPDRLVICPGGKVFFMELKAEGGHLSDGQIAKQRELRNAGHTVITCSRASTLRKFLSTFFK